MQLTKAELYFRFFVVDARGKMRKNKIAFQFIINKQRHELVNQVQKEEEKKQAMDVNELLSMKITKFSSSLFYGNCHEKSSKRDSLLNRIKGKSIINEILPMMMLLTGRIIKFW